MEALFDNTPPSELPNILFDILGGDNLEKTAFERNMEGVALFLEKHGDIIRDKFNLALIGGKKEEILAFLTKRKFDNELIEQILWEYAKRQCPMDFKKATEDEKRNNSIATATHLMQDPRNIAFFTNGSTEGAVSLSSPPLRKRIGTPVNQKAKSVPALCVEFPSPKRTKIIDVGADSNYEYNYDDNDSEPTNEKKLAGNKYIRLLYSAKKS